MSKLEIVFFIFVILIIQCTFAIQFDSKPDVAEPATLDSIIEMLQSVFDSDTYKNAKSEGIKLGEEIEAVFKEIIEQPSNQA